MPVKWLVCLQISHFYATISKIFAFRQRLGNIEIA